MRNKIKHSMREGILCVLLRELRRMSSSSIYLFVLIVFPLACFFLFTEIFKNGVPHKIPIAVCDADASVMSRKAARMVNATPSVDACYRVTSFNEGKELMMRGKISAFVLISKDFERDIYRGNPTKIALYVNNLNILKGGLLDRDIRTALATLNAGVDLQGRMKKGESAKLAVAQVMPVVLEKKMLYNPFGSYAYYLLTALLPVMLQMFIITASVYAVNVEMKDGTAREWLKASGFDVISAITGKMIPYSVIFFIISLFMSTLLYRFIGVPLRGSRLILILSNLFFVLAYQGVGIFITCLISNLRLSLSMSSAYAICAFTFSGLTFPFIGMPSVIAILGQFFPFTQYLDIYISQGLRGAPIYTALFPLGMLGLFILFPLLLLPKLQKHMMYTKYWGGV
ncbi:ABC-2 type transport system permease protein [Acetobacteroides hydrogenigenes]|uniref:ABC-2 type transport system permease protein n=2 Tax=Acetobacteroides hydrogenigenes TaxID=979970 RepID=A0A4R2EA09_9BACT|nr:ABC-2 type transport system permease protein [Acetobacteroides hydrogenigenes]